MTTTIAIHKNIHTLIVEKQQEIRNKYKMFIKISDIVEVIIKNGIVNIESFLGLGKEIKRIKESDIINMAKKIGTEIIYVKENMSDISSVPNCCGVYIVTTESGRDYVGASLDIYNRIRTHNIDDEPIRSISIYLTRNKSDADLLERLLICELNPEINTKKPMSFSFNAETKTVPIEDDVYWLLVDKQKEILKIYGTNITIFQIVDVLLKNYIDKIEELFRINMEKMKSERYENVAER